MLREGSKVSYTGPVTGGPALGDQGRVLSVSGSTAHVMWETGQMASQVTPEYDTDLATLSRAASADILGDSLEVGGLVSFAVRSTYDVGGEVAVLNAMAESGHLAGFAEIAEEALATVAARVRSDVSFRVVLAELDEEEAESLLRLASACLIRDAFGEPE